MNIIFLPMSMSNAFMYPRPSQFKGNTKFWYGVMNLVQMKILEAYAIQQYSVIVVAVESESKVMKL